MTVLFMKDWRDSKGQPRAIYDLSTSNRSFVVMSERLKLMGIKNYLFPLSLYDTSLKGVRPHELDEETDPSGEIRKRVVQECKRNFWYWLREVARVPPAGGDPMPVRLDRGGLAMAWCYLNSIKYIGIQPRQTGKSTMALLITVWLFCVAGKNVSIGMLAHQDKLRSQNVSRIKDLRALLPRYMVENTVKNINNAEKLYYHGLNNSYLTAVATNEVAKADQILRGQALTFVHWDEPAFCANADLTYPTLIASGSEAMDQAFANGLPCGFILTTTAGDPNTRPGKWAMTIVQEAVNYSERFFDLKDRDTLVQLVNDNSENGFVNGTFSHLQLGKTNKWLMERIQGSKNNIDAIQRDWLNRWNTVVGDTILSKDLVKRISASMRSEPDYYELREGLAISWYVPEAERIAYRNKPIVLGMDTSDTVGRDSTTFVGIDPNTFEVILTFKCNEINSVKLIDFIVNFVMDYPRMVLVPERNRASNLIDKLATLMYARGICPFHRIYNRVVQEIGNPRFRDLNINDPAIMDTEHRRHLGFVTSGGSRDILYKSVLQQAASLAADVIYDPNLITEITSLEVKNGRVDHKTGSHDDMVISWMLACYLLLEGQNLSYYGLMENTRIQFASASGSKKAVDAQIELYKKIADLRTKVAEIDDPFQKNIVEMQIRKLESRIDKSIRIDPLTLDAVKKEVGVNDNKKPKTSSIDNALDQWRSYGL